MLTLLTGFCLGIGFCTFCAKPYNKIKDFISYFVKTIKKD